MRHGSVLQRMPVGSKWVQVCGNKALSLLMSVQEFRCREFHNISLVSSAYPAPPYGIRGPVTILHFVFSLSVPTVHIKAIFCRRGILPWGEKQHLSPTLAFSHTFPKLWGTKGNFFFFFFKDQDLKEKLLSQLSNRSISWDLKLWVHVKKSDPTMNY